MPTKKSNEALNLAMEGEALSSGMARPRAERGGQHDRFFSLSPDLMCIAGKDGYFKSVNPAFMRTLGYPEKELLERPFIEFVHPDDRQAALDEVERLLRGEVARDFENRFGCKDGSYRWLAWTAVADKQEGLIYGTARDITERKKVEDALAESEQRFRLLVESSPFCIHEIDMDGRLQSMNRAGLDMLGLKEEREVCGMAYMGAVGQADQDRIAALLRKAYEGTVSHFEFVSSGENPLYFRSCFVPIRDAGGKVLKLMGITEDITERKRFEETLRESEERLKKVIETSPIGMVMVDKDLDPAMINSTFVEMFGYTAADIPSVKDWWQLAYPDPGYRAAVVAEWDRRVAKAIREQGKMEPMEARVTCRSGEIKDIEFSFTSIGESGLVVFYDITSRKRAETELREAKEHAEEATRLKDKFVSLVAHDLRTPLAAISGFIKLMQRDKEDPLPQRHAEIMDRVLESCDHMLHVIQEVLNIARLKTGSIVPQPEFTDGYTIVAQAAASVNLMAQRKGVKIVNEVRPGTRLYVDRPLFSEVLKNLLSNAVKFSNKGGAITLFSPADAKAAIAVKDTGIGIDPAILPDIFKHEVKTSTPGTANEAGTGLGLPYSQDIMKAHGGTLEAVPGGSGGTIFFARLPVVRPRVILVDDSRHIRLLLSEYLKDLDVDIYEAADGEEGLAAVKKHKPHLVIADIVMENVDGLELLRNIRSDPGTAATPVILITGDNTSEKGDLALRVGADDFMLKPINREEFLLRVRRYIH